MGLLLDLLALISGTGTTYSYAGSGGVVFGGTAVVSGPAAANDSRGFTRRRHAHTSIEFVPAVAVASTVIFGLRGDAKVLTVGTDVPVSVGIVSVYSDVSIAAQPSAVGVGVRVTRGSVHVQSDSRIEVPSHVVTVHMASISVMASTVIPVHGQRVRTSVGHVSVEIGPDLVQAEEDELFFLLEVA